MPNERDIQLDKYEISKYAYRELKYFCLQYPEKKAWLNRLHSSQYLLRPTAVDGMPHSSDPGNPTAHAGEKAARLSRDCELIEQTAIEADAGIYQQLLKAVTQDVSYWQLKCCDGIPCGKDYFYACRRKFFYLLAKKQGK